MIVHSEDGSVRRVLSAAAFTYLAAAGLRLAVFLFWFLLFAIGFKIGGL